MLEQVYARDLQVGDILSKTQRTIEAIAVSPDKVILALSGKGYAKLKPDDIIAIVARDLPDN